MAVEVVMPKLGMAMKEGSVSLWQKKVGDSVTKGEAIASINSEKIEMDLEAPEDGVILDIIVPEDQGVPPGTVICYIGQPDESVSKNAASKSNSISQSENIESSVAVTTVEEQSKKTLIQKRGAIKISPVARKMAESHGLDIESIKGTGPNGRITKADVEKLIMNTTKEDTKKEENESNQISQEQKETIPVSGMRKVIAKRMHESLLTSAQLTMTMKVDVTEFLSLYKQVKADVQNRYEVKLSLNDLMARAVVLALKENKMVNSAFMDEQIHIYEHIHLGIAVSLENGLVVPVIRHAEECSLVELAKKSKSLINRAREGQLSNDEIKGSTFTITNLGSYGIEFFTPILNSPESGILGIGAVEETPIFVGEDIRKRNLLPLSFTFDHRVLDGAPAAQFLKTVKKYLEEPITILV